MNKLKVRYKLLLLFLFAGIIYFTSCSKSVQSKLVGSWELVSFDKNPSEYTFTFTDGDIVYYERKLPDGTVKKDTAFYYVEKTFPRTYLKLYKFNYIGIFDIPDGKWWVEQLDSKILKMQRTEKPDLSGSYLRFEFIKK